MSLTKNCHFTVFSGQGLDRIRIDWHKIDGESSSTDLTGRLPVSPQQLAAQSSRYVALAAQVAFFICKRTKSLHLVRHTINCQSDDRLLCFGLVIGPHANAI